MRRHKSSGKTMRHQVRDQVRAHWANRQSTIDSHKPVPTVLSPLLPVHSELLADYPQAKSLGQILRDPHVTEFWLFSFQLHVDYIFSQLDITTCNRKNTRIHLVGEERTVVAKRPLTSYPNLIFHSVRIPRSWGSHHSKLIFSLRDDNTLQIHLPSFNLSREEISLVRQMIWNSPCLRKANDLSAKPPTSAAAAQSRFQTQLLQYLDSYPDSLLHELRTIVASYNFSPLDQTNCQFVYSTPYNGGLSMLRQCVGDEGVDTFPNLFIQVSSIGNRVHRRHQFLYDIFIPYLYTDGFTRDSLKQNTPYAANAELLWPTKFEMENCATKGLSKGWFFYKSDNALRQALRKHGGKHRPIQVPSHTKFYAEYIDEETIERPRWVLFTSHNLSQSAWGATPWERPSSYECGVLYKRADCGRIIDLRLRWAGDVVDVVAVDDVDDVTTVQLLTPYTLQELERYDEDEMEHVSFA